MIIRTHFVHLLLASVLLLGGLALAGEGDVALEGSFLWTASDGDVDGPLEAVFTPTGENAWSVSFYFDWEDGPHVYTGTANGNLKTGQLNGEVESDNKEHPATFRFTGTHGYLRDGELKERGTLTLQPAG